MLAKKVFHHRRRGWTCAFALLLATCAPLPASATLTATPPDWPRAKFDYVAQRQDLRQVLRDFARAMRIDLDLADDVEGKVTGRFDMAPPVLLDMLGSFHQFVWHFDGAVLYVGSSKPGAPKLRLRPQPDAGRASAAESARTAPAAGVAAAGDKASASAVHSASVSPGQSASAGVKPSWVVKLEDGTLSKTFARWAHDAGWQLLWEMPVDFRIDANTRLEGEFEQAVTTVADSLADADSPMQVVLYRGNHVIRVTSQGTR